MIGSNCSHFQYVYGGKFVRACVIVSDVGFFFGLAFRSILPILFVGYELYFAFSGRWMSAMYEFCSKLIALYYDIAC